MQMVTLYVGAGSVAELTPLVGRRFDSFTLLEGLGVFRGAAEKVWLIKIATSDLPTLLTLAEEIRALFQQDGVGIECDGCYYRVTAKNLPAKLIKQIESGCRYFPKQL